MAYDLHRLRQPGLFSKAARLDGQGRITKKAFAWLQQHVPSIKNRYCAQSRRAVLASTASCCRNDAVLFKDDGATWLAGEVLAFFRIGTEPVAVVTTWKLVTFKREWARAMWLVTTDLRLVPLTDVLCSVTYTRCKNDRVMSLIPYLFR